WFWWDSSPAGWAAKCLHHLKFFDKDSPDTYRFLDPDSVIQGIHLIPGFTFPIDPEDLNSDSQFHYLNIFINHDMFMRFHSGGIRHKAT
ncbi:hypothetical protein BDR04DRAFT_956114, partial [Suillus decipiens]